MNKRFLCSAIMASAAIAGLAVAARAQNDPEKNGPAAEQKKPEPKLHKVWTNDEVRTLRTPADEHIQAVERQKEEAALAARQSAAGAQTENVKPVVNAGPPPVFTNPKSLEDADNMIAWETRDIESQVDFLANLNKEIDEAPEDQKERLNKLLQERTQLLANTREELKTVQLKKKEFEKPRVAGQSESVQPLPQ